MNKIRRIEKLLLLYTDFFELIIVIKRHYALMKHQNITFPRNTHFFKKVERKEIRK